MDGALQSVQVNIMKRESRNKAFIEVVIDKKNWVLTFKFCIKSGLIYWKKSQNQVDQEHSVISDDHHKVGYCISFLKKSLLGFESQLFIRFAFDKRRLQP